MTLTNTYRKTKTGEWATMGPAATIKPGATVTVHKKSGEIKTETIDHVGREVQVEGRAMVYGYTADKESSSGHRERSGNGRTTCLACGDELEDFDLRAACVPGYHFDCV